MKFDFAHFLAADLAEPSVTELCNSGISFHAVAMRLAAKVGCPGTGIWFVSLFEDLVVTEFKFVFLAENNCFPSGSMDILDFHTMIAEADATISLTLFKPALSRTDFDRILSLSFVLVIVLAALLRDRLTCSVRVVEPLI